MENSKLVAVSEMGLRAWLQTLTGLSAPLPAPYSLVPLRVGLLMRRSSLIAHRMYRYMLSTCL